MVCFNMCCCWINYQVLNFLVVETSRSGLNVDGGDFVEIQVKAGLGDVHCTKKDLGGGNFAVTFRPVLPLLHRVHVLIHGYNAKGCPFDVLGSDEGVHAKDTVATGSGLYLARAARSAGFTILTKGMQLICLLETRAICNL